MAASTSSRPTATRAPDRRQRDHPAVAGGGRQAGDTPGDAGPPATEVAAAPDGGVYLANGNRVRRVGPDGIITTAAGGNSGRPLGDGGPATRRALGFVDGLAVAPPGELYIGHATRLGRQPHPPRRHRRHDHDRRGRGRRTRTAAATAGRAPRPRSAPSRHGRRAATGPVLRGAPAAATPSAGSAPDGTITTAAGARGPRRAAATAARRRQAGLGEVVGVAVAPDGSYYVGHHGDVNFSGRVRRVSRPLPVRQGGRGLIPSSDGAQAYEFDADGPPPAHARRSDRRRLLLRFVYDSGRLSAVIDARRQHHDRRALRRDADGASSRLAASAPSSRSRATAG